LRRQAVDREILGRAAVAKAAGEVDLDAAHLADLLDAGELRLTVTQGGCGADLVVDVGVGADPTDDLARSVADRHGAGQMPAIDAVSAPQAELLFVDAALSQRLLPGRNRALEVLGLDHLAPTVPQKIVWPGARVF